MDQLLKLGKIPFLAIQLPYPSFIVVEILLFLALESLQLLLVAPLLLTHSFRCLSIPSFSTRLGFKCFGEFIFLLYKILLILNLNVLALRISMHALYRNLIYVQKKSL